MLQSILNSVQALSPKDGHILMVGDLWIHRQDWEDSCGDLFKQCPAALLALRAAEQGHSVTFVGFVGDDALADAVDAAFAAAGVAGDLLHIKHWTTFTDAALEIPAEPPAKDASGRSVRRHKDERALPIDGMSEYQSHLQNRAERYLRNAAALVIADFGLGSVAEPRALAYVADQQNKPCLAMLGRLAPAEKYQGLQVYQNARDDNSHAVAEDVMNKLKDLIT